MKKVAAFLLILVLTLSLCACGSEATVGQEQYEPETEQEVNSEILSAESNGEGTENSESEGEDIAASQDVQEISSPETAPNLPDPLQFMTAEMSDTAGEPIFTAENYVPTNASSMEALEKLIDAGLAGDKESIWKLVQEASVWTPLVTDGSNAAIPTSDHTMYSFWTVWGDNLLRVRYGTTVYSGPDVGEFVMVDYREKNGTGFMTGLFDGQSSDQKYFYSQGKTTDWLLNGDTEFILHYYGGWDQTFRDVVQTAVIVNDMPDGPVTVTAVDGTVRNFTFSAGNCPEWWRNPAEISYGYTAGNLLG